MKYTTIRIEGAILSSDILDKIEQGELGGQLARDFGFDTKIRVKDEIARAWADAQDLWRIFKRQQEKVAEQEYGTTETRKFWMIPLLGLFGYDAQLSKAETVHGKSYAVSHRVTNLDRFPIHIVGFNDSLDKKRTDSGPRMSPHALLQEYINLTEHLYTIVTNGIHLRLLRDSSRLIKLSFIEFDLETMMEEEHYADFAIMYRLLHSSRMPLKTDMGAESLIEKYHQDALDSGSRIREGLSNAVEYSISSLANGFLRHADNEDLREKIDNEKISASKFYQYQLRLIYRLLFLMVIEERNLIYPANADKTKREIYYEYYSVNHLRRLCEKRYLADQRFNDLWIVLKNTFHLFESEIKGKHLGLSPLAGDLFGYNAIGILNQCNLDNKILLECLRNLSVFINKKTGQKMRVNYASLNVEEFGSVYEGLLEYDPVITKQGGVYQFDFVKGSGRSSSGSHYTPDELVQPLIKHSLDYVIKDKLKSSDEKSEKEKALLSIKVCDVACGSGHILLNAARRIGTELAKVKTGEDQPSPAPLRQAIRDVIKSCIYGVDKNPLAVELCKVALWLEAHNPGEPLNFLDHHIKCGDAIVGLAHKEELENGIADEAFKKMPGDEKDIRAELAKRNKREREKTEVRERFYQYKFKESIDHVSKLFEQFNSLPETTVEEIEQKRSVYQKMTSGQSWWRLKTLADIRLAQFFIPKNESNANKIVTEAEYRDFLGGRKPMQGPKVGKAMGVAQGKRFFHWFLEFPEIFSGGGFDCILGNPPFLGGRNITAQLGKIYNDVLLKLHKSPGSSADLSSYFLKRTWQLINNQGRIGLITVESIASGKTKENGLDVVIQDEGSIIWANTNVSWPGNPNRKVTTIGISKIKSIRNILNRKEVSAINSNLKTAIDISLSPERLFQNLQKCFQGITVNGKEFIITKGKRDEYCNKDQKLIKVLKPYFTGEDLNRNFEQVSKSYVINFYGMNEVEASKFSVLYRYLLLNVKQKREAITSRKDVSTKWWSIQRVAPELEEAMRGKEFVICRTRYGAYNAFDLVKPQYLFSDGIIVFCYDDIWMYAILQSDIHYCWSLFFGSSRAGSLRYKIKPCFESYPFPQNLSDKVVIELENIASLYKEHRSKVMYKIELGLTKIYNLLNTKDITVDYVIKASKQSQEICEEAYNDILKLRKLHKEMNETVLKAYNWEDIDLAHDFYEVDYLPENDRVRYTISPDARKEILKRLLKLNHEIHEQEVKAGLHAKGITKKKQKADASGQMKLF